MNRRNVKAALEGAAWGLLAGGVASLLLWFLIMPALAKVFS